MCAFTVHEKVVRHNRIERVELNCFFVIILKEKFYYSAYVLNYENCLLVMYEISPILFQALKSLPLPIQSISNSVHLQTS